MAVGATEFQSRRLARCPHFAGAGMIRLTSDGVIERVLRLAWTAHP